MIKKRKASQSKITMAQLMLPEDANTTMRNVHGGTIMKLIDNAGAVVAMRYSLGNVVTVCIDELNFLKRAHVGDLLILDASVICARESSMEVEVNVKTEDLKTGDCSEVVRANLVFAAVDEKGEKTRPVPELITNTVESKKKFKDAERRFKLRIRKGFELAQLIGKRDAGT